MNTTDTAATHSPLKLPTQPLLMEKYTYPLLAGTRLVVTPNPYVPPIAQLIGLLYWEIETLNHTDYFGELVDNIDAHIIDSYNSPGMWSVIRMTMDVDIRFKIPHPELLDEFGDLLYNPYVGVPTPSVALASCTAVLEGITCAKCSGPLILYSRNQLKKTQDLATRDETKFTCLNCQPRLKAARHTALAHIVDDTLGPDSVHSNFTRPLSTRLPDVLGAVLGEDGDVDVEAYERQKDAYCPVDWVATLMNTSVKARAFLLTLDKDLDIAITLDAAHREEDLWDLGVTGDELSFSGTGSAHIPSAAYGIEPGIDMPMPDDEDLFHHGQTEPDTSVGDYGAGSDFDAHDTWAQLAGMPPGGGPRQAQAIDYSTACEGRFFTSALDELKRAGILIPTLPGDSALIPGTKSNQGLFRPDQLYFDVVGPFFETEHNIALLRILAGQSLRDVTGGLLATSLRRTSGDQDHDSAQTLAREKIKSTQRAALTRAPKDLGQAARRAADARTALIAAWREEVPHKDGYLIPADGTIPTTGLVLSDGLEPYIEEAPHTELVTTGEAFLNYLHDAYLDWVLNCTDTLCTWWGLPILTSAELDRIRGILGSLVPACAPSFLVDMVAYALTNSRPTAKDYGGFTAPGSQAGHYTPALTGCTTPEQLIAALERMRGKLRQQGGFAAHAPEWSGAALVAVELFPEFPHAVLLACEYTGLIPVADVECMESLIFSTAVFACGFNEWRGWMLSPKTYEDTDTDTDNSGVNDRDKGTGKGTGKGKGKAGDTDHVRGHSTGHGKYHQLLDDTADRGGDGDSGSPSQGASGSSGSSENATSGDGTDDDSGSAADGGAPLTPTAPQATPISSVSTPTTATPQLADVIDLTSRRPTTPKADADADADEPGAKPAKDSGEEPGEKPAKGSGKESAKGSGKGPGEGQAKRPAKQRAKGPGSKDADNDADSPKD